MGCVSSSATADISAQQRISGSTTTGSQNPVGNVSADRIRQAGTNSWRVTTEPSRPSQPAEAPTRNNFGSQEELDAQREDFWGSRSDGDAMVWTTLRSAAEAYIGDDIGLSEAILAASGINSPSGTLELCYDERGYEYKVPAYCYLPSAGLITVVNTSSERVSELNDDCEMVMRKGPPGSGLRLKVKINPGDHLLLIDVFENDTIAVLKQKILEKSTVASEVKEAGRTAPPICTVSRQRMIFMGKELKNEKQRLIDAKMDEAKVVQVFLKPVPNNK